ncbi:MAG TPA: hypothetical protein P5137_00545 [Candidatus Brocadiia bacterium]|nr:hypothetical protein [Candidatus Brocadiia bacterium]
MRHPYARPILTLALAASVLVPLARPVAAAADPMPKLTKTWAEVGGQVYGAQPDERGPIGGGAGYRDIFASGSTRVSTADALIAALKNAKAGDVVFIEGGAEIDFTDLVFAEKLVLQIPEGVTLASDRGRDGSPGALIYSRAYKTEPLIATLGPNVRLTGLRLRGPDPETRTDHHRRAFNSQRGGPKEQKDYYYSLPLATGIQASFPGLTVDNCELWAWSHSAISLHEGEGHHIHHNYIHHNQRRGLGYGVTVNRGAALIERNLFDHNRHSIAGTGRLPGGYEACHNFEWRSELYIKHAFDMHANPDGSGKAGLNIYIHHNTFTNPKVRAVAIRARPEALARVTRNWFYHEQPGGSVILPWPLTPDKNVVMEDNAYGAEQPMVLDRPGASFAQDMALAAQAEKARRLGAAMSVLDRALLAAKPGAEQAQVLRRMGSIEEARDRLPAAIQIWSRLAALPGASPEDAAFARQRLDSQELKAWRFDQPVKDWSLAFEDRFDRQDLGDWDVVSGDWLVEKGRLVCRGEGGTGIIYLNKRFPWPQRVECVVQSGAPTPCDLSPILQSDASDINPWYQTVIPGYMFQFGANRNKTNQLRRNMQRLWENKLRTSRKDILIVPGKAHELIAEFDGKAARLTVDGQVVLELEEKEPLMGPGHDMVGFYINGGGAISRVRVYQPGRKTPATP